jgi:hypothetical protein
VNDESQILVTVGDRRLRVPFPHELTEEEEERAEAAVGGTLSDEEPDVRDVWRALIFVAFEREGLDRGWLSRREEDELVELLQKRATAKLAKKRIPRGKRPKRRRR